MNIDPAFLKRCDQYEQALHRVTNSHKFDFNSYYHVPVPFTNVAANISRDSIVGRVISIVRLVFDYCLFGYGVSKGIDLGIIKIQSFDAWSRNNNIYYYKRDVIRCFKIWDDVLHQFESVHNNKSEFEDKVNQQMQALVDRVQGLIEFTGLSNIYHNNVGQIDDKNSLYNNLIQINTSDVQSKVDARKQLNVLYDTFGCNTFKQLISSADYFTSYSKVVEKLISVGLDIQREFNIDQLKPLLCDSQQDNEKGASKEVERRVQTGLFLNTNLDVTGSFLFADPSLSYFPYHHENLNKYISNFKQSLIEITKVALQTHNQQPSQYVQPNINIIQTYVNAVLKASNNRRMIREQSGERIDYLSKLKVDDVVRSFFHITHSMGLHCLDNKGADLQRVLSQIQINITCSFDESLHSDPSESVTNTLQSYGGFAGKAYTVDVSGGKQLVMPPNVNGYFSYLLEKSFNQIQPKGTLPNIHEQNIRFRKNGSVCFLPSDLKQASVFDVHEFVLSACKKVKATHVNSNGLYNEIIEELFPTDQYDELRGLIVSMAECYIPTWTSGINDTQSANSKGAMKRKFDDIVGRFVTLDDKSYEIRDNLVDEIVDYFEDAINQFNYGTEKKDNYIDELRKRYGFSLATC